MSTLAVSAACYHGLRYNFVSDSDNFGYCYNLLIESPWLVADPRNSVCITLAWQLFCCMSCLYSERVNALYDIFQMNGVILDCSVVGSLSFINETNSTCGSDSHPMRLLSCAPATMTVPPVPSPAAPSPTASPAVPSPTPNPEPTTSTEPTQANEATSSDTVAGSSANGTWIGIGVGVGAATLVVAVVVLVVFLRRRSKRQQPPMNELDGNNAAATKDSSTIYASTSAIMSSPVPSNYLNLAPTTDGNTDRPIPKDTIYANSNVVVEKTIYANANLQQ
jgi:hypothetical protein